MKEYIYEMLCFPKKCSLSLAKFEFCVDLDNFFYAKCGDTIESAFLYKRRKLFATPQCANHKPTKQCWASNFQLTQIPEMNIPLMLSQDIIRIKKIEKITKQTNKTNKNTSNARHRLALNRWSFGMIFPSCKYAVLSQQYVTKNHQQTLHKNITECLSK